MVRNLKLEDHIDIKGYISDDEIVHLYRNATALVMPTAFGPTNLPYLEAWAYSCPVITSDIRGIQEQVGDAGILVNPLDPSSIAEGVARLIKSKGLRERLIQRGKHRIQAWTPQDFTDQLGKIITVIISNV
jgi:glycosyltransferase involved in cell wall biosynthesis